MSELTDQERIEAAIQAGVLIADHLGRVEEASAEQWILRAFYNLFVEPVIMDEKEGVTRP